jgi:esterase/lipase superfamily enzyme
LETGHAFTEGVGRTASASRPGLLGACRIMVTMRDRRVFLRLAGAGLTSLALAGCVTDAVETGGLSTPEPRAALDRRPVLLVATTRRPAKDVSQAPFFGSERGRGLAFATAHLAGPDGSLISRVSSVVSDGWSVKSVDRLDTGAGAAQAFAQTALGRDVLIYVHGYRESFESAAVGAAMLSSGIGFRGASALFTWPSAASTFDYGYDRESALWSRDAFEDLLRALAATQSGGRINIVAHSMGTLLTLETLRMLRADAGEAAMSRIGAVVLAAPDIDIDLFTNGIERLGSDAKKITVISSTNDRALDISSRLAGGVLRAGAASRERLEGLGVRVADASDYGGGLINHDLFLSNQEVQGVVKRALARADGY